MEMSDKERIRSRSHRLAAYLRHNAGRMVVDLSVLTAWLLTTWTTFNWFDIPTWSFYVVLFTGAVAYSRITPPWERPYRSPD